MKKFYSVIAVVLVVFFLPVVGLGQVSITSTGTAFTQDFDGMGTSGTATVPTGFKIGTDWSTGTTATTLAYGTTGTGVVTSGSSGGIINWANGVTGSSTERSLGFLNSGSFTSPQSIVYAFTNNTGVSISTLSINFDYEKSRSGSRAFDWTFFHGSTSTPSTAANAGDQSYATDASNATIYNPPITTSKSFSITGLTITSGSTYYLKWTFTGVGGSSNGQGIGLDNFSLTAAASGFTTTQNGDWHTPSTWTGGVVPTSADNVSINHAVSVNSLDITRDIGTITTISVGASLAVTKTYTNNGITTINGTFQLNAGGYADGTTDFVYNTNSYLIFNNGGTYDVTAGQRFWPSANQPHNITVNTGSNANLNDGARTIAGTMSLYGGFINTAGITVNGTLLINQNGYVSIQTPNYGASSLLRYNTNANPYNNGYEWSSATNAANVQLSGGVVLNYPAIGLAARTITGTLTIDLGSSLFMDYGAPAPGVGALTVGGNVVINGSLSPGNQIGGDLVVKGNWTLTGTFNNNNRLVNFNGTSPQTLTGSTAFGYFKIDNASGLTLSGASSNVVINSNADFTLGKITLGTNNFVLNTGSSIGTAGTTSYVVTNGTGRFTRNQTGNVLTLFPVGTTTSYTPLTMVNTGIVNDITVGVNIPVTNAVADATKIVNLEWSVISSGAGTNANITYQWSGIL